MGILLIGGSPSQISRTGRLLNHVGLYLKREGLQTETLLVRDLPADALIHADYTHPQIVAALAQVAGAEAIVIATPVYKAAYSGVLKTFIDIWPQFGLKGKVVLPLATGGSAAHTLILDYALRPVLASLAPKQVLDSVYAVDSQVVWSEENGLTLDSSVEQRIRDGVRNLVDSISLASNASNSHKQPHAVAA